MRPPLFTSLSYGAASLCHGVLAVTLLTIWRDRARATGLPTAVAATALWAACAAIVTPSPLSAPVVVSELLKVVAWALFVSRTVAPRGSRAGRTAIYAAPLLVAAAAGALTMSGAEGEGASGGHAEAGRALFGSMLLLSVYGFVVTENAARNTKSSRAWAVKFVWLAAGALFAYDAVLYSIAFLTRSIPPSMWAARGLTAALVVPLIAISVARTERLQRQFIVSERLVFYAASTAVAAVYLVVVALLADAVRQWGGAWGAALGVSFGFAGLLALAALALSGSARARLRVLFAKHLLSYKYNYRTEWLQLTERLTRDDNGSSLAERILDAFKRLTRASDGGVWIRDDERLVPRAGGWFDAPPPSEPCDSPFCRYVEDHDWIVDLDQTRAGTGRDAEVPIPAWLAGARSAWLAIPLRQERRLVALVVLARPLAAGPLTWEDLDLLRMAARQAASYVALEQAAEALSRERQFAAMHRITAFLMHDLSNVVAQQRLLVDNAATHKSNPRFIDDAISTISETARRMSRLLDQVKAGVSNAVPERVCIAVACRSTIARLADRLPCPVLEVTDETATALVPAERLDRVVEHLVRNAQDATPSSGSVTVRVYSDGACVSIAVVDTGRGMDERFVQERLFRPFETTKGAAGMGLGAFEVREFARAVGGELEVASAPGKGTSVVLRFPRLGMTN